MAGMSVSGEIATNDTGCTHWPAPGKKTRREFGRAEDHVAFSCVFIPSESSNNATPDVQVPGCWCTASRINPVPVQIDAIDRAVVSASHPLPLAGIAAE